MGSSYGQWGLVIINVAIFTIFAFSFSHPQTKRDWRSFGGCTAFLVALFTEMYGFPLTIYLLSGWLSKKLPGLDLFSHNSGHLLEDFIGWGGDPHFGPFHILSYIFIVVGFTFLSRSWQVLYQSQKEHTLAVTGPYARVRHPQYIGFVAVMFGFLLQWPTLLTLLMFPILIFMYTRLAYREEKEMEKEFGDTYREYCKQVPAFIPRFRSRKMVSYRS